MWEAQMPALLAHFQVLRPDLRGHGASDSPPGDYTMAQLAQDVLAAAPREHFFYCGLSLGGMIGQWLAARYPQRVARLVLANTSPRVTDPALFEARRRTVLAEGMEAVVQPAMDRFFSSPANRWAATICFTLRNTDPAGYAGCCAAIRDMDHRPLLQSIAVPTLVIGGPNDASTPWSGHGDVLAASIPGAAAAIIDAAHLSNLERPAAFTGALLKFLLPECEPGALDAGFAVRRAVLGNEHVDRAIANTTDFTREFQEWITRYGWGTVWTRPGLDPATRRLLVLAMMASLGRWEEFRMHVRTGLQAELEPETLREVLLAVALYAGVPAANSGFHIASEELTERSRR
jgi:3-oxoadipate enol-lactonase/4-carboxymuconolactone decarboxylase